MRLSNLKIQNHPILKDIEFDFINKQTGKPYSIVAFIGENGCGKTTLLNEIFNYYHSKYIVEKDVNRKYLATFLRQGQLYYSSMDHIKKLINGSDPSFPSESKELSSLPKSDNTLYASNGIGDISIFNDEKIKEVFEKEEPTFIPGGKVAKLIDGKESDFDYDSFSSGQQELIFKLQTIKNIKTGTDFLLMDEPETSLHPRWQKIIVDYLISRLVVDDEFKPQIFIATHSEKILESLINNKDVLIIRLFKENGTIKTESINQMQLLLRKPTFAELDYVIFKIDSYEYCNELFDLLEWRYGVSGDRGVDRNIRRSEFYDKEKHYKEWFNDKFNEITCYTLPVYVRNYFHHPKDKVEPTPYELHEAIELLRNIISKLI